MDERLSDRERRCFARGYMSAFRQARRELYALRESLAIELDGVRADVRWLKRLVDAIYGRPSGENGRPATWQ